MIQAKKRPMGTTSLPHSASEPGNPFDRLHPLVTRWIWDQGWDELRDVQARSIEAIISGSDDVLIAAATAAGKTEAAFLPILTQVAETARDQLKVLYVSPLKALINDQFRRLDGLCERMEIPVTRWHGDAPQAAKQRIIRQPAGAVLITPESIEALLVRRPADAKRLFSKLEFVVIDELHAFLTGPRGLHLASLLNRIEILTGQRPRRLGLSATLGDLGLAARWLNPANPKSVECIESSVERSELKVQIRGYIEPPDESGADDMEVENGHRHAIDEIADHLFKVLRGKNHLVFGGSRRTVETLSDRLRRRSESANVPNEFFPHHGSLSKDLREELEDRLKAGSLPTTAIATTTLELGIDIGSVASIAQIGAPRSLSSLRQRLGRSGRRKGAPSVLRIYVRERHLDADADPLDRLRLASVRAMAAVRLLVGRFVESPGEDQALVTAVLHQTLAMIMQQGGGRAATLYSALCRQHPFSTLSQADYAELLRGMAAIEPPLLEQAPDGVLMLGPLGEKIVHSKEFYALFESDQEWRLVAEGKLLGTIPISNVVVLGSLIGFAGRRWKVNAIDDLAKVLSVIQHPSARLPKFERLFAEPMADRLVAEMREVYLSSDVPPYLNSEAAGLVNEGRAAFQELGLNSARLISSGKDTHAITWRGSQANDCLAVAFIAAGFECEVNDLGITVADTTPDEVRRLCQQRKQALSSEDLSAFVETLRLAKYDDFIPDGLLRRGWAHRYREAAEKLPEILSELSG